MERAILQVDACIVCALKEEADAVEQVVSEHCQIAFATGTTGDGRLVYRYATIINNKQEPLTLLLLCQTRPGLVYATRDLGKLLEEFQPRFVGMSGICAGDKRRLHLGDLVVAECAYHFEEGKVTRDQQGELVHQPEGITHDPAEHILRYVRAFGAWKTPVTELKKRVLNTDEPPRCVMALMASGMAVRGDDPFEVLQRQHRKAWALDMEAAAFYQTLRATPFVDGLVIKGVCDYANLSKDDAFHDFAARASALYLLTFIQEYVTTDTLKRERGGPLSVFTVPYPRNLFFTGRDELLTQIHTHFQTRQAIALALSGLGGIGKTQIAVEYAHQHQHEYQAVLWIHADTREALVSRYVAFADQLKLRPQDKQDQTNVIEAVKVWLATHGKWLLILDNADNLPILSEFLPSRFDGHILITTRAHAVGNRARIDVHPMPPDVGTLFLLRRVRLITSDANLAEAACADIATAREIRAELGGLPLALDQAGAYIEEMQCGLSDYLERYQMHREDLLKRRGRQTAEHPQSVAATFSFAFEQVQQKKLAAIELLKFASFLAPDAIPLELITQGKVNLGAVLGPVATDALQLDQALETLHAYSLIQRNGKNRTLSVHRLVRAVLQESMTLHEYAQWQRRAKKAVSALTACDRCRRETGKRAEEQVATYFDPVRGKDIVIPYRLPLFCDACQEDLSALAEEQTAFALARDRATLGIGASGSYANDP